MRAPSRLGVLALGVLVPAVLVCGPASAAWVATGSGTVSARAGALTAPDAVGSACITNDDVRVTWSHAGAAAAFTVQRTANAGGSWSSIGSVPVLPGLTSYSHDDVDLPPGSYAYRVVAVAGTWQATSGTSPTRTLVEAKGKKPRPVTCS